MGLPSSGQISINDIATEFGVTLANVALNATLGTYADKASGATTAISDFYGLSALTAFDYNAEGTEEGPTAACSLEATEDTAYHDGSGTYPAQGDKVYSADGTSVLENGFTYKYNNGTGGGGYLNIGESGEVSSLGNCK